MKIVIPFFLVLLSMGSLRAQSFPIDTLQYTGPDDNRIVLVMLGDGYRTSEMDAFRRDAANVATKLFETTPFREYRNFFNVYALETPSNEAGADHPGTATDVSEPAHPLATVDTRFGSTFDYAGIHRLLVATEGGAVLSTLLRQFPQYDQSLIVVNSPYYGGSGGSYPTTSAEARSADIAIHELGHSFAGLADEYYAGDVYAGERANMTRETNPALVRWKNWVNTEGVGIYQHCCGGQSAQWYRPHEDCLMRYLGRPFCAVCQEAILDRIYRLVGPIDEVEPAQAEQVFAGVPLTFRYSGQRPAPNTLTVQWQLNDALVAADTAAVTLQEQQLPLSENRLVLQIRDDTPLSRTYTYPEGYVFRREWTISRDGATGVDPQPGIDRLWYRLYPNPVVDRLFVAYEVQGVFSQLQLSILDLNGRTMLTRAVPLGAGQHTAEVDLSGLAAGMYTAVLEMPGLRRSFLVVKP